MTAPQQRPHILHLNFGTELGGTETMILHYLDHADTGSFRYSVAAFAHRGPLLQEAARRGCRTLLLGMRSERDLLGILRAVPRLHRFMRQERVALVHTYGLHTGIIGRAVARSAGARVVAGQRTADSRRPRMHSLLNRLTSRWVDLYVSNSEAGRRLLIERDGIPAARAITVRSGIDPQWGRDLGAGDRPGHRDRSFPGAEKIGEHDAVVGMIAHFRRGKLFHQLIRVGDMVLRSIPAVKFVLAGDGETRGRIERLAQETEGRSAFVFAGALADIGPLLRQLDLFVLATETEGLPVSIIEAMAVGKPVIATQVGGIPELVEDGITGLLVRPGDDHALADAILRLLRDPALARRMGEAGRRRIAESFGIESMVKRLEQIYRHVLELDRHEPGVDRRVPGVDGHVLAADRDVPGGGGSASR
ncbi:hypothetical protein AMJ39_03345 [candidate division TA06 bacterium DG_24]|uniref:Glycosyltransferase subfamily 4-like N-terminal domain-containing protein n=2 Tax=Bacteria division TA06 TaxID=1156500 RepID=A0A0S8G5B7_UNCT6|nr:MAG: hypothetical protein AMJ39_03345 [candidate division TA06 bacterium DG_24]KPK67098.1 MAG: hypothetical protein AMJ82_11265 [candidate division TA06 bacterium SM23_40]